MTDTPGGSPASARPLAEEALSLCAQWFREYEASHNEKGDHIKANRNRDRAEYCERASALSRAGQHSDADIRGLCASDYACHTWPEDTTEHRTARDAYVRGAIDARNVISPPSPTVAAALEIDTLRPQLAQAVWEKQKAGAYAMVDAVLKSATLHAAIQALVDKKVEEERERCARLMEHETPDQISASLATAIRKVRT